MGALWVAYAKALYDSILVFIRVSLDFCKLSLIIGTLLVFIRFIRNPMKKTFSLTHPKINLARRVEAVKHEIKKYQTRERKKAVPADTDFWDFECKFGSSEQDARVIHVAEINKEIDQLVAAEQDTFYLEIMAVGRQRQKLASLTQPGDDDDDLDVTGE